MALARVWEAGSHSSAIFLNTVMKITELVRGKPAPKKINRGNGGKVTIQYSDDIPDTVNPIAKSVLTQPHLRQRAQPNKRFYNRKKKDKTDNG